MPAKKAASKKKTTASKKKLAKKAPKGRSAAAKPKAPHKPSSKKTKPAKSASPKKVAKPLVAPKSQPKPTGTKTMANGPKKPAPRPASAFAPRRGGPSILSGPVRGFVPYQLRRGEDYMNKAQLEHFRNLLLAWKRELMSEGQLAELLKVGRVELRGVIDQIELEERDTDELLKLPD